MNVHDQKRATDLIVRVSLPRPSGPLNHPALCALTPQCMPSRSSHGRSIGKDDLSNVFIDPSDLLHVSLASRHWIARFKPVETTAKFSNNETRQDGDGYMT